MLTKIYYWIYELNPDYGYEYAIKNNNLPAVQYLTECGYRIPWHVSKIATENGNIEMLEYLREHGLYLYGCMRIAVEKRNKELITYLAKFKISDSEIIKYIDIDDFEYLISVNYFNNIRNLLIDIFNHNRIDLLDYLIKNHNISWIDIIGISFKINSDMKNYLTTIDLFPTFK